MAFNKLDDNQKSFIKAKVKELGNLEAVKSFYHRPCLVSRYALSVAKKEFKNDKSSSIKISRTGFKTHPITRMQKPSDHRR